MLVSLTICHMHFLYIYCRVTLRYALITSIFLQLMFIIVT